MKFPLLYILLFAMLLACGKDDSPNTPTTPEPNSEEPALTDPGTVPLLSVSGKQILDTDANPIYLKGIVFNNWHWLVDPLPPTSHHSEIDFERVAAMGMNAVRFHLNYSIFEDDSNPYQYKQTGWDWIDKNVEWAKKNNVYLILNMHTPPGGYQSQGDGDAVWDNVDNQDRLVALWKAIAERYREEPQIAGYGVLNEPVPNRSIDQWSELAQRLVDEVRKVDNHIVFVEQAIQVKGQEASDPELNFPRVTGTNIVYEFHTYEPYLFTHQLMSFSGVGEGGSYPNEDILEIGDSEWYTTIFDNPSLTTNSDWAYFKGDPYYVEDTNIKIGVPILNVGNIGAAGKVNFDDIELKEYDENGDFVRNIATDLLNSAAGWTFWSRNGTGSGGLDNNDGRTDTFSLSISGSTEQSVLGNRLGSFKPIQGYSYEIGGWMKAEQLASGGDAVFRIDFYNTDETVQSRNKAYLESVFDKVKAWGDAKNVPLYVGEVGTGAPSFENNKGGIIWAEDMINICLERNIHFTYFDYHDDNFGIYLGNETLPDPSNVRQPMIDLLTETLK